MNKQTLYVGPDLRPLGAHESSLIRDGDKVVCLKDGTIKTALRADTQMVLFFDEYGILGTEWLRFMAVLPGQGFHLRYDKDSKPSPSAL
jgi:hypothetical protein